MDLKTCCRCKIAQPEDCFALMSIKTGKRQGYCRKCFSELYKSRPKSKSAYNKRAPTKEQKARRSRQTLEHRRRKAEHYRAYAKDYRERNKEKLRAQDRARSQKGRKRSIKKYDPVKGRARNVLNYALRRGEIARLPCQVCGNEKVQAHHDDYSKPLDVRWLCVEHHIALHKGF